jgi:hypothetical protein
MRHGVLVESIGDSSGPSLTGVTNAPRHDNRVGHPYPAVVERYRLLGTLVIHTDEHGAITVRTNGQSVRIEPYTGQPLTLPHLATQHLAETTLSSPAAAPR